MQLKEGLPFGPHKNNGELTRIPDPRVLKVSPIGDCDDCSNFCCKSCFRKDEGNLFRSLSTEEMDALMQSKHEVRFRPGETIFKQNTGSSHLICFRRGVAKVYVEGENDKNLIVKVVKDSDIVVSGGILTHSVRPFTVAAVTAVECCFIDSAKIVELLFANLRFALAFLEKYHSQSNQMFNTLVMLTQKYMPGKVADTLLNLRNNIFVQNPFQVPFSRQELADMSAMSKESFVRVLSEFKDSGLVAIHGKAIEILDEEGLTALSRNG